MGGRARGLPWAPVAPSAHLSDAGTRESHNHGHHIDRQLELQELGDAVVDIAAPHDGLDDAGEVVVRQDDVRGFLCHVSPRDALGDTHTVSAGPLPQPPSPTPNVSLY